MAPNLVNIHPFDLSQSFVMFVIKGEI